GGKQAELKPLSIPQPMIPLGQSGNLKAYQVLGTRGPSSTGETMVRSGDSISGFAYYIFQYCGWDEWSLTSQDGTVTGKIVVSDVFGNRTSARFVFKEITLD